MSKFTLTPTLSQEEYEQLKKRESIADTIYNKKVSKEDIQPDQEDTPTKDILENSDNKTEPTEPVIDHTPIQEDAQNKDVVKGIVEEEVKTSLIVLDEDNTNNAATSDADNHDNSVQDSTDVSDGEEQSVSDDGSSDNVDTGESGESPESDADTDDTQDGSTETGEDSHNDEDNPEPTGASDDHTTTDSSDDSSQLEDDKTKDESPSDDKSELEEDKSSDEDSDKKSELEEEKENFSADDLTNDKDEADKVEDENPELDKKTNQSEENTDDSTDVTDTTDDASGDTAEDTGTEATPTDDASNDTSTDDTDTQDTEEVSKEEWNEIKDYQIKHSLYLALESLDNLEHSLVFSDPSFEEYRAIRQELGYIVFKHNLSSIALESIQEDPIYNRNKLLDSIQNTRVTLEELVISSEGALAKNVYKMFFGKPVYNTVANINGIFFRAFGKAYWADPSTFKSRGQIEKAIEAIISKIDRDQDIEWVEIQKNILSTPQKIPVSDKEIWIVLEKHAKEVKDKFVKRYDKKKVAMLKATDRDKLRDVCRRDGTLNNILTLCKRLPKMG